MTGPALPTIRVLHHLARTGGTLISKCLASMDGNLLLSEVHPNGRLHNPLRQAQGWFGLFTPEDLQRFDGRVFSFPEAIGLIEERARARGRRLILRDWTHLDYTAVPFLPQPSYRLLTAELLAGRFRVVHTATVRHPLDQWLSLRRLALMQGKLAPERFLEGCRRFAERAQAIGFVRYEDFLATPDAALGALCGRLELPFDPGYRQRWSRYDKITGDRAEGGDAIRLRPRRPVDPELAALFRGNGDYRETVRILGYSEGAADPPP